MAQAWAGYNVSMAGVQAERSVASARFQLAQASAQDAASFSSVQVASMSTALSAAWSWASNTFTLDHMANFAAGWGDTLTGNLTYRIRAARGWNEGIDTSSGWYVGGQVVGTVHLVLMGINAGATCAGGWAVNTAVTWNRALTAQGVVQSSYNVLTTGKLTVTDALNLLPVAAYGAGKALKWLNGWNCFVAGTQVVVGEEKGMRGQPARRAKGMRC